MSANRIAIGVYEAKTHLPALLRNIKKGKSYTITVRGEKIADLSRAVSAHEKIADTLEAIMQLQDRITAHSTFGGLAFVQSAKEEGRR